MFFSDNSIDFLSDYSLYKSLYFYLLMYIFFFNKIQPKKKINIIFFFYISSISFTRNVNCYFYKIYSSAEIFNSFKENSCYYFNKFNFFFFFIVKILFFLFLLNLLNFLSLFFYYTAIPVDYKYLFEYFLLTIHLN